MNFKRYLTQTGIFALAFLLGYLGVLFWVSSKPAKQTEVSAKQPQISLSNDQGSGCGECSLDPTRLNSVMDCYACKDGRRVITPTEERKESKENVPSKIVGLKIISKPRPDYTEEARQNNIQGAVRLRVTFLASGQIGAVSTIYGLPDGLTEKAIAAARQIQFEPAKRDGRSISVVKMVEYSFTLY